MHSLTLVSTKSRHSLSHREREIHRYSYLAHNLRHLVPKLCLGTVFLKRKVDAVTQTFALTPERNTTRIDLCVVMKSSGFLTLMEFMLPYS